MLIKVKNPDLYRAWCNYLEKSNGKLTCTERTTAFFNSQSGIPVPLFG